MEVRRSESTHQSRFSCYRPLARSLFPELPRDGADAGLRTRSSPHLLIASRSKPAKRATPRTPVHRGARPRRSKRPCIRPTHAARRRAVSGGGSGSTEQGGGVDREVNASRQRGDRSGRSRGACRHPARGDTPRNSRRRSGRPRKRIGGASGRLPPWVSCSLRCSGRPRCRCKIRGHGNRDKR